MLQGAQPRWLCGFVCPSEQRIPAGAARGGQKPPGLWGLCCIPPLLLMPRISAVLPCPPSPPHVTREPLRRCREGIPHVPQILLASV